MGRKERNAPDLSLYTYNLLMIVVKTDVAQAWTAQLACDSILLLPDTYVFLIFHFIYAQSVDMVWIKVFLYDVTANSRQPLCQSWDIPVIESNGIGIHSGPKKYPGFLMTNQILNDSHHFEVPTTQYKAYFPHVTKL